MKYWTKEIARCYLVVEHEIDDNLLTEEQKKRIKQILSNRKKNAWQFTEEDSKAFIKIEEELNRKDGIEYYTDESIEDIDEREFDGFYDFQINF